MERFDEVQQAINALLETAGVPLEDTFREQAVVFVKALQKNAGRERTYGGLWREYGLEDCANNAKSKSVRMVHHARQLETMAPAPDALQQHDDAMDDAIDLINYGAFAARLIDEHAVKNGLVPNDFDS